jgi:hypothetical protein
MVEWMYKPMFSSLRHYLEVSGQLQAPPALPSREGAPGTHLIWVWVGPRTGLDDLETRKFLTVPGLELRSLGRPACSQSLYRLSYPSSQLNAKLFHISTGINFCTFVDWELFCSFQWVLYRLMTVTLFFTPCTSMQHRNFVKYINV